MPFIDTICSPTFAGSRAVDSKSSSHGSHQGLADSAKSLQGAAEGNLADAMSRMLGVYVGLKGEIVPENVKKWNVLKVRTHVKLPPLSMCSEQLSRHTVMPCRAACGELLS